MALDDNAARFFGPSMEELLAHILANIFLFLLEVVGEIAFELGGEALMEGVSRVVTTLWPSDATRNRVLFVFVFVFLGAGAGWISLALFPHPIFPRTRFRGISLLISPIVSGWIMSRIGAALTRRGGRVLRIETFPYAYLFALGMALVRLAFI